eukprot:scaffold15173_cov40-Prasinocladus_malaysianus.AAC.1
MEAIVEEKAALNEQASRLAAQQEELQAGKAAVAAKQDQVMAVSAENEMLLKMVEDLRQRLAASLDSHEAARQEDGNPSGAALETIQELTDARSAAASAVEEAERLKETHRMEIQ